jgi:hypothetical protein
MADALIAILTDECGFKPATADEIANLLTEVPPLTLCDLSVHTRGGYETPKALKSATQEGLIDCKVSKRAHRDMIMSWASKPGHTTALTLKVTTLANQQRFSVAVKHNQAVHVTLSASLSC